MAAATELGAEPTLSLHPQIWEGPVPPALGSPFRRPWVGRRGPHAPEDRASAAHAGFIIYKLLSSLWSNPLERVFNISETDKPSIAQADSQS